MKRLATAIITTLVSEALLAAALEAAPTYEERDFLTRIRRLTVEGRRSGEGYFSTSTTTPMRSTR